MRLMISGYGSSDQYGKKHQYKSVRMSFKVSDLTATLSERGVRAGNKFEPAIILEGRTRKVNMESANNSVKAYFHDFEPTEALRLAARLIEYSRTATGERADKALEAESVKARKEILTEMFLTTVDRDDEHSGYTVPVEELLLLVSFIEKHAEVWKSLCSDDSILAKFREETDAQIRRRREHLAKSVETLKLMSMIRNHYSRAAYLDSRGIKLVE